MNNAGLELSDWLYLGIGPVVLVMALTVLKVSYTMKSFVPLPARKPRFVLLPKYVVSIPIEATQDMEDELCSRLAAFGFQVKRRDPSVLAFTRGSVLGDFSIKITKLTATTSIPVSNPAPFEIEYSVIFGCAFDTGDLWKFCQELMQKLELEQSDHAPIESGNPYQSPRT